MCYITKHNNFRPFWSLTLLYWRVPEFTGILINVCTTTTSRKRTIGKITHKSYIDIYTDQNNEIMSILEGHCELFEMDVQIILYNSNWRLDSEQLCWLFPFGHFFPDILNDQIILHIHYTEREMAITPLACLANHSASLRPAASWIVVFIFRPIITRRAVFVNTV